MARNHARVMCSIWNDTDFVSLTPLEQRMFLLLLSQPDLSLCGLLAYRPKRWARLAPSETIKGVEATIRRLEERRYVIVDHDTDELWIRSFIRWDGILRANPNMQQAMRNALGEVMSEAILEGFEKVHAECMAEGLAKAPGVREGVGEGEGAGPKKIESAAAASQQIRAARDALRAGKADRKHEPFKDSA